MSRLLSSFALLLGVASVVAGPIRLHPENPRWFQWQNEAVALITSAEHYGAVLNLDFDYPTYLAALERDGMNYTRIFAGTYVEPPGAFNITHNTLAPADGQFLAPWARSDQPGYLGGGHKFDLHQFNPDYLARLHDFITTAHHHGIIVELTFFTSTYNEKQWSVHPFNPTNRIQSFAVTDWEKLHTTANGAEVMAIQEKLVRWLVRELNPHDNLFYEIQNEPWFDNQIDGHDLNPYVPDKNKWLKTTQLTHADSIAWQRRIAQIITEEESQLPQTHLIAQNVANFRLAVSNSDIAPEVSILNFHYANPAAVTWNRGFNRVIGYDESGFAGRENKTYRRQAWNFIMSGGGLFNNLDYSFHVGAEDGSGIANEAPGGGSPSLRNQLRILSNFVHHFELSTLNPDQNVVTHAPGVITRTLSLPCQHYLIYLEGRSPTTIHLSLPPGTWKSEWIDVLTGVIVHRANHTTHTPPTKIDSPNFTGEIALRIFQ